MANKHRYIWVLILVGVVLSYISLVVVAVILSRSKMTEDHKKSVLKSMKYPANPNDCPKDSPHLYYMNLANCSSLMEISRKECSSPVLCLPYCPGMTYIPDFNDSDEEEGWTDKRDFMFCLKSFNDSRGVKAPATFDEYSVKVSQGLCPREIYRCSSFFNKICLPSELDEPLLQHLNPRNYTPTSINGTRVEVPLYILVRSREMFNLWVTVASSIAAAFVIIYILLFTFCVRATVYVSLILFVLFLFGGCLFCFTMIVITLKFPHWIDLPIDIVWYVWFILGLFSALFLYLYFDFIRKCYYTIPKAIDFLIYASRGIGRLRSTLFFIILSVLVQLFMLASFFYFLFLIHTSGAKLWKVMDLSPDCICINGYKNDSQCTEVEFNKWCRDRVSGKKCSRGGCYLYSVSLTSFEISLISCLVLITKYIMWFVKGAVDMILGTTIVQWYKENFKSRIPFSKIAEKTCYCLRYQIGTLTVGAAVMVFLGVFHTLLQFVEHLVLYTSDMKRIKRRRFAISFLDSLSKMTSSLIFVMAGVYNVSYCEAVRRIDLTMASRIKNVRLINKLVDMVLFICSLVVMVSTLAALLFVYTYPKRFIKSVASAEIYNIMSSPWFIMVVIVVGAYFLVANILSMYSISVNAIFITYIADVPEEVSRKRKYNSSKIISEEVNPDKFDVLNMLNDLDENERSTLEIY